MEGLGLRPYYGILYGSNTTATKNRIIYIIIIRYLVAVKNKNNKILYGTIEKNLNNKFSAT